MKVLIGSLRRVVGTFIVLLTMFATPFGQIRLDQIAMEYERGEFESVVRHANAILESDSVSRQSRVKVLKLLTQAHLFINQKEEAGESYRSILKTDPNFQPEELDPMILKNLSKEYSVRQNILFNYSLGFTVSSGGRIAQYDVGQVEAKRYWPYAGWRLGIGCDFLLRKNLFLTAQVQASSRRIGVEQISEYQNAGFQNGTNRHRLRYREFMSFLEMPISVKKHFGRKRKQYYLRGGFTPSWMISANRKKITLQREDKLGSEEVYAEANDNAIYDQRNHLNVSLFYALGVNWQGKRNNFFLEYRQNFGLLNLVSPDTRYSNVNNLVQLQLIDDDYLLHSWSFSFGFARPISHKVIRKKEL